MLELIKDGFRSRLKSITVLIWIVGSLAAAVAAPFGSHEIPTFAGRVLYWSIAIVSSTFFGSRIRLLARRLVDAQSPVKTDATFVALMALIFTPFIWGVTVLFDFPGSHAPNILQMAFYVALVSVVVCVLRRVVPGHEPVSYFQSDDEPKAPSPRLMRRLPKSCEGSIIRLNVSDHQVRVITTDGEYVVRLRFGDAIEEMDPIDGFCTHRSHWVVKQAVNGWEQEKGKTYLKLVNGDRVPVSKTYRPDLEAAGVI